MRQRLPYLYEGTVTRRDDPEGLGRVRLAIPGLIEPETPDWVEPLGVAGGGFAQRGTFEPPAIGANVAVLFKLGEVEHPRYLVGSWGDPGGVSDVPTNAEVEGENRQNAVTEDEEWRIERDSRSAEKRLTITHRTTDLQIVLDATVQDSVIVRTNSGQALELKGATQEANLDSGGGPALALDAASQTVGLVLGSGPALELFAGGFSLSASSPPEFAGIGGKAKLGDRNATEKVVLGTTYRTDEAAFLSALAAALHTFATSAKLSTDPTLALAATALELTMNSTPIINSKIRTDAAHVGYLSQNVDVQE
jgi:hypothetical protein